MKKPLVALIALLVIGVSVYSIMRQSSGPQTKSDLKAFVGMGEVAADQAIKAANNHGQVAIWMYENADTTSPAMKTLLKSLTDTLKKASGIRLGTTEKIPYQAAGETSSALPRATFLPLMQRFADTDVIISFVGVPKLTAQDVQSLGAKHPLLVVIDTFEFNGQPAQYDPALVKAAIVPRLEVIPPNAPRPKTARQAFDRYFQVLTAE